MAEPDVRPPDAAISSAKSVQEDEIPLAVMAGRMKKFSENTSTIPKVMNSSKFSQFFFWGGGTPVPLRVCASKPWLISSVCRNSRAQHPP